MTPDSRLQFQFENVDTLFMHFFLLLFIALFTPIAGQAVSILNVKGDRVLLDLDGEDFQPGDRLVALSPSGKEKSLIQVKQVKGSKAIATILNGKVEVGYDIEKTESSETDLTLDEDDLESTKKSTSRKKVTQKRKRNPSSAWGIVVGAASNNVTVKPGNTTATQLSGSSTIITAFYQRTLDGSISTRILGGTYGFAASGESTNISACTPGGCKLEISYMGLEALVQYSIIKNSTLNLWVGAGMGFLFASSKSSNVVDTSKISSNQTFLASLGSDWNISNTLFIPLQMDYVLFPDNNTSSASQMIVRLGIGSRF